MGHVDFEGRIPSIPEEMIGGFSSDDGFMHRKQRYNHNNQSNPYRTNPTQPPHLNPFIRIRLIPKIPMILFTSIRTGSPLRLKIPITIRLTTALSYGLPFPQLQIQTKARAKVVARGRDTAGRLSVGDMVCAKACDGAGDY